MRNKNKPQGFPGGTVDKESPAHAEDTGWVPDPEDPHDAEQWRPWTTTTEPVPQGPQAETAEAHTPRACALWREKPSPRAARAQQQSVAPARRNQRKPWAAMKTQCSQKYFFKQNKTEKFDF